jgi:uncharacterized membrane protein YqjE
MPISPKERKDQLGHSQKRIRTAMISMDYSRLKLLLINALEQCFFPDFNLVLIKQLRRSAS